LKTFATIEEPLEIELRCTYNIRNLEHTIVLASIQDNPLAVGVYYNRLQSTWL